MNDEGIKPFVIGVLGTLTSLGLTQISLIACILSALMTAAYGAMKCIDWLEARAEKRRAKRQN